MREENELRRRKDETMERTNLESQNRRQREVQELKKLLQREPSSSKNVHNAYNEILTELN